MQGEKTSKPETEDADTTPNLFKNIYLYKYVIYIIIIYPISQSTALLISLHLH